MAGSIRGSARHEGPRDGPSCSPDGRAAPAKPWRPSSSLAVKVGAAILILALGSAVAAPVLAPHDPLRQNLGNALARPGRAHLLGTDNEPISNMNPPTLALVAMTFWSVGLAILARRRLSRWLEAAGPWKAVIFGNSIVMTLFLWHTTAYLFAVIALWPLGFGRATDSTARWWLERPLWLAVPAVFLAGLVAVFARFERPAARERGALAR